MNSEYESLREEMKSWQERRFTVLTGSIALVTGILGLKIVGESKPSDSWPWASALLLVLLASACALGWYARRANAKIAAYLIVFHDSDSIAWESRLLRLKNLKKDFWDLDRVMIPIYFILALVSLLAPMLSHPDYTMVWADHAALALAGTVFLVTQILLGCPAPRARYVTLWKKLGDNSNGA